MSDSAVGSGSSCGSGGGDAAVLADGISIYGNGAAFDDDAVGQMSELARCSILLLLIWGLSLLFRQMRAELLGGIVAGLLLGPGVAGWIAYEKACS